MVEVQVCADDAVDAVITSRQGSEKTFLESEGTRCPRVASADAGVDDDAIIGSFDDEAMDGKQNLGLVSADVRIDPGSAF